MRDIKGLPFAIWAFLLCYGSVSGDGIANGLFLPIQRDQFDDSPSSLWIHVLGLQWIKPYQYESPADAYYPARNGGDDKNRRPAPNEIIPGSYPQNGLQNWPPPPPLPQNLQNPVTVFMDQLDKPIPNLQYGPPIMGNTRLNEPPPYIGTNEIRGRSPNFGILPNPQPWVNKFYQGRLINPVNQMWGLYNPQGYFPNGIRQSNQNSRIYSNEDEIQAPGIFPYQGSDPRIPRSYIMEITNPGNQLTLRNPYGVIYPWVPAIPIDARGRYPFPPVPAPPTMQYPVQRLYPYITGHPLVFTNKEDTLAGQSPNQNEHPVGQSGNQTKVEKIDDNISPSAGEYFIKRLDRTR